MPELQITTNGKISIASYNTGEFLLHIHYNL